MEIQKDNEGKWIRPQWGKYLTQALANKDEERVIVKQVYIPNDQSNDEWIEISQEDVDRINKVKKAAHGEVIYPEEINQVLDLFTMTINTLSLTDEQALQIKNIYPTWESFINKKLEKDYKVQYQDKLYKVKQTIELVLENQPPSIDTAALYEEINESNKGTLEDPIPYNNNMELFEGKYYSQNGVVYKCTRNTEQAVYQDLSGLVDIYVEKVEE